MKNKFFALPLTALALSVALGTAGAASITAGTSLSTTINSQAQSADQWFTYQVNMEPGNGMPCCFSHLNSTDKSMRRTRGCSLEDNHSSWGNGHLDADSSTLDIYFQWEDGKPAKLFFAGSECPVDAAGYTVVDVKGVSQRSSLEFLSEALEDNSTGKRGSSRLIGAIAMHEGDYAQQKMEQLSNNSAENIRHKAIFWLGQARGKAGFQTLVDIVDDNNREMDDRTKAIFGLSESSYEHAADKLLQLAKFGGAATIQNKAIFWLAQSNNPQIAAVIKDVLASSASMQVKEKAVFSLSQLQTIEGWDMLVDLARSSELREVREKAVFWLSQGSNRGKRDAAPILMDIIDGENPQSIKEKAVFALSQLPDDQATLALTNVLKSSHSKAIKKKALFWLGQSNDPRAMEVIEQILAGE
ncbi:MAG: hypothetical protein MJK04_00635 [Psychrosphaera sp.]|nr:hypothetical protein [Psychrosphaera sp.]